MTGGACVVGGMHGGDVCMAMGDYPSQWIDQFPHLRIHFLCISGPSDD